MYVKELHYRNVGPISELNTVFRFDEENRPVPTIFVGKNGSGKSIVLSNIIDAFYEIADIEYNNATQPTRNGHQYYKKIAPMQIRFGQNYMVAHICLQQASQEFDYVFKSGNIPFREYNAANEKKIIDILKWQDDEHYKNVSVDNPIVVDIFEKNVVCYFSPDRFMPPAWIGDKYIVDKNIDTYSMSTKYANNLKNPITAENISQVTLQWLFDIIADSRAELRYMEGKLAVPPQDANDLLLLSIARKNVEKIMSEILEENVFFKMGNRSMGEQRFNICRQDGSLVVSSLNALSTGQLTLFNLFATIIRYADTDNINFSHKIEEIEGVVVIDEIELHLHAYLQREILPKLIKLFPKVQFIITSHSPLFLLGMEEQFGKDNIDIIDMPEGKKISVEQFAEFENAYTYFIKTNRYQREIKEAIDNNKEKTLIITEGATDWKHMKAAYDTLVSDSRCKEWLTELEFDFLEYEPKNNEVHAKHKLEMSASQLLEMCQYYKMIKQPRKMIFIADCDLPDIKEQMSNGESYKNWSNSVYSFCLPIPEHRRTTPDISIEHLYTDEEIKRSVLNEDGVVRRIFMGNEFDEAGFSVGEEKYCCKNIKCCGSNKIDIIDGSNKKKVIKPWNGDNTVNYALTKMNFANLVLEKKPPFDNMDFSNFIPLFEMIREIIDEK